MKAVITVIGHDKVGIIARVSALLSESNVNILDITHLCSYKHNPLGQAPLPLSSRAL